MHELGLRGCVGNATVKFAKANSCLIPLYFISRNVILSHGVHDLDYVWLKKSTYEISNQ